MAQECRKKQPCRQFPATRDSSKHSTAARLAFCDCQQCLSLFDERGENTLLHIRRF